MSYGTFLLLQKYIFFQFLQPEFENDSTNKKINNLII